MCSCVGACCGGCAAGCLGSCGKGGSFIPYIALLFISSAVALILRYWGAPLTIHLFSGYDYDVYNCGDDCVGYGTVYRISFALVLFFAFHSIALIVGRCSISGYACAKIDYGGWWWKLLLFIVLLILTWIIPDTFYTNGYVHVARIGAAFFLLLQIVVLIDFAFRWNEAWTNPERSMFIGVILSWFLLFSMNIVLIVLSFVYLAGTGCGVEQFFVSFTLVAAVVMSILAATERVGKGLLPGLFVSAYCSWLCFSSLASNPSSCNTLSSNNQFQLISGIILGTASIAYSAYDIATNGHLFPGPSAEDEQAAVKEDEHDDSQGDGQESSDKQSVEMDKDKKKESNNETIQQIRHRSTRFHTIMIFSSMYMAMLLTNWGSLQALNGSTNVAYDLSVETMWVKIITQWVCIILFTWSLLAPIILKDRDFS